MKDMYIYIYIYIYIEYICTHISRGFVLKSRENKSHKNSFVFRPVVYDILPFYLREVRPKLTPPFCEHFISHSLFCKIKFDRGTRGRPRPPTHPSADRSRTQQKSATNTSDRIASLPMLSIMWHRRRTIRIDMCY